MVVIPVECSYCEQSWDRDPALEVECPQCYAEPGSRCRRPSGHPVNIGTQLHGIHKDRDRKALDVVEEYEPCPDSPVESLEQGRDNSLGYDQAGLGRWQR